MQIQYSIVASSDYITEVPVETDKSVVLLEDTISSRSESVIHVALTGGVKTPFNPLIYPVEKIVKGEECEKITAILEQPQIQTQCDVRSVASNAPIRCGDVRENVNVLQCPDMQLVSLTVVSWTKLLLWLEGSLRCGLLLVSKVRVHFCRAVGHADVTRGAIKTILFHKMAIEATRSDNSNERESIHFFGK